MMKKLRFKSEFKNITDTDNWINFHEKKKCVIFFFLVYINLSFITKPSVFLIQANFLWVRHSETLW